MTLNDKIIEKLKTVMDPEIRQDVYSLKLIYDIKTDEEKGEVSLKFRPTVYQCPIGIQLSISIKRALMELKELKKVDLEVTDYVQKDLANQYLSSLDNEMYNSTKEEE
ncbi:MAG: iron-sulfur cluster assembly protein [Acidobacteriota bacterium]